MPETGFWYTVKGGDNWNNISEHYYGSERGFADLLKANLGVNPSSTRDNPISISLTKGDKIWILPDSEVDVGRDISQQFLDNLNWQGKGGIQFWTDPEFQSLATKGAETLKVIEDTPPFSMENIGSASPIENMSALVAMGVVPQNAILGPDIHEFGTIVDPTISLDKGDILFFDVKANKITNKNIGDDGQLTVPLYYDEEGALTDEKTIMRAEINPASTPKDLYAQMAGFSPGVFADAHRTEWDVRLASLVGAKRETIAELAAKSEAGETDYVVVPPVIGGTELVPIALPGADEGATTVFSSIFPGLVARAAAIKVMKEEDVGFVKRQFLGSLAALPETNLIRGFIHAFTYMDESAKQYLASSGRERGSFVDASITFGATILQVIEAGTYTAWGGWANIIRNMTNKPYSKEEALAIEDNVKRVISEAAIYWGSSVELWNDTAAGKFSANADVIPVPFSHDLVNLVGDEDAPWYYRTFDNYADNPEMIDDLPFEHWQDEAQIRADKLSQDIIDASIQIADIKENAYSIYDTGDSQGAVDALVEGYKIEMDLPGAKFGGWMNAYTWVIEEESDRLANFLNGLAFAELQVGHRLGKWEVLAIRRQYENASTELLGEIAFDLTNLIPGKIGGEIFEDLFKVTAKQGLKNVGIKVGKNVDNFLKASSAFGSSYKKLQPVKDYLFKVADVYAEKQMRVGINNMIYGLTRGAGNATEAQDILRSIANIMADQERLLAEAGEDFILKGTIEANTKLALRDVGGVFIDGNRLETILKMADTIPASQWRGIFEEAVFSSRELLYRQGETLGRILGKADIKDFAKAFAESRAGKLGNLAGAVGDAFGDAFRVSNASWKGSRISDKTFTHAIYKMFGILEDVTVKGLTVVKPKAKYLKGVKRVEGAYKFYGTAMGFWVKAILTARPGWYFINMVDSTFRFVLGGGGLFDNLADIFTSIHADDIPIPSNLGGNIMLDAAADIAGGRTAGILNNLPSLMLSTNDSAFSLISKGIGENFKARMLDISTETSGAMKTWKVLKAIPAAPAKAWTDLWGGLNTSLEYGLRLKMYYRKFLENARRLDAPTLARTLEGLSPELQKVAEQFWYSSGHNADRLKQLIASFDGTDLTGRAAWRFYIPVELRDFVSKNMPEVEDRLLREMGEALVEKARRLQSIGKEVTVDTLNEFLDDAYKVLEDAVNDKIAAVADLKKLQEATGLSNNIGKLEDVGDDVALAALAEEEIRQTTVDNLVGTVPYVDGEGKVIGRVIPFVESARMQTRFNDFAITANRNFDSASGLLEDINRFGNVAQNKKVAKFADQFAALNREQLQVTSLLTKGPNEIATKRLGEIEKTLDGMYDDVKGIMDEILKEDSARSRALSELYTSGLTAEDLAKQPDIPFDYHEIQAELLNPKTSDAFVTKTHPGVHQAFEEGWNKETVIFRDNLKTIREIGDGETADLLGAYRENYDWMRIGVNNLQFQLKPKPSGPIAWENFFQGRINNAHVAGDHIGDMNRAMEAGSTALPWHTKESALEGYGIRIGYTENGRAYPIVPDGFGGWVERDDELAMTALTRFTGVKDESSAQLFLWENHSGSVSGLTEADLAKQAVKAETVPMSAYNTVKRYEAGKFNITGDNVRISEKFRQTLRDIGIGEDDISSLGKSELYFKLEEVVKASETYKVGADVRPPGSSRNLKPIEVADQAEAWRVYSLSKNLGNRFGHHNVKTYDGFIEFMNKQLDEVDELIPFAGEMRRVLTDVETGFGKVQSVRYPEIFGYKPGPIENWHLSDNIKTYIKASDMGVEELAQLRDLIDVWKSSARKEGVVSKLALSEGQVSELNEWATRAVPAKQEVVDLSVFGGRSPIIDRDINGAQDYTAKLMLDYTNGSQVDQTIKQAIPFWTFQSRSVPFWIEKMIQKPEIATFYSKYLRFTETVARQRNYVNSRGEVMESLQGYVSIPGTDIWFNPTSSLSFRYLFETSASPFGSDDGDREELGFMGNTTRRIYEFTQINGLSLAPWITVSMNALGYLDTSEKWSMFPQGQLVPAKAQKWIRDHLNRSAPGLQSFLETTFLPPEVSWKDYLIEKEMFGRAYEQMTTTNMTHAEKVKLIDLITKVLSGDARSDHELWLEAEKAIDSSAYWRQTMGYFTGIYAKERTHGEVELNNLRNEMNGLRLAINNELLADYLQLDEYALARQDFYNNKRYETPEGFFYNLYNTVRWTVKIDEDNKIRQLEGQERRDDISSSIAEQQDTERFFHTLSQNKDSMVKELWEYPIGTPYAVTSPVYDKYFESNLLARRFAPLISGRWSVERKSADAIREHFANEWYGMLKDTRPSYTKELESYAEYQVRLSAWEDTIPDIAQTLMLSWMRELDLNDQLGAGMDSSFLNSLLEQSNIEALEAWDRGNDSLYGALGKGWTSEYWNVYWDMIGGKSAAERELAERAFLQLFPKAPDSQFMFAYLEQNYPGNWTLQDVKIALGEVSDEEAFSTAVLSIEERLSQTAVSPELLEQQNKVWDVLSWVGGGVALKAFKKRMTSYGLRPETLDIWYAIGGESAVWGTGDQFQDFYEKLISISNDMKLRPPSTPELERRAFAEEINKDFKSIANDLNFKGISVFDIMTNYYGQTYEEQKRFRVEEADEYAVLESYFDLKDEYARLYPEWGLFYYPEGIQEGANPFNGSIVALLPSNLARVTERFVTGETSSLSSSDRQSLNDVKNQQGFSDMGLDQWLDSVIKNEFEVIKNFSDDFLAFEGAPEISAYGQQELISYFESKGATGLSGEVTTDLINYWKEIGKPRSFVEWLNAEIYSNYILSLDKSN